MTVLPFKIPKPKKDALIYQEDQEIIFYGQLHQHEEIQISLIVAGSGSLTVGDSIRDYKKMIFLLLEKIYLMFFGVILIPHRNQ